jgi:hypothetical protein
VDLKRPHGAGTWATPTSTLKLVLESSHEEISASVWCAWKWLVIAFFLLFFANYSPRLGLLGWVVWPGVGSSLNLYI